MEHPRKVIQQIVSGEIDAREVNESLTVERDLYLSYTAIEELPNNLTVRGSIYLSHTGIKELPDDLTVTGNLDLTSTAIKELPENLTVGGWLGLRSTAIKELPDSLTVGGDIELTRTNIENYPVVYDCGKYNRAIYLSLTDKSIIVIGCYRGTQDQAIERIKSEYSGFEAADYILKIKQCFSMYKDLQQKKILN